MSVFRVLPQSPRCGSIGLSLTSLTSLTYSSSKAPVPRTTASARRWSASSRTPAPTPGNRYPQANGCGSRRRPRSPTGYATPPPRRCRLPSRTLAQWRGGAGKRVLDVFRSVWSGDHGFASGGVWFVGLNPMVVAQPHARTVANRASGGAPPRTRPQTRPLSGPLAPTCRDLVFPGVRGQPVGRSRDRRLGEAVCAEAGRAMHGHGGHCWRTEKPEPRAMRETPADLRRIGDLNPGRDRSLTALAVRRHRPD